MSIEQNKAVAIEFFKRVGANDIESALDLMAEEGKYWMAGKPEAIPTAGYFPLEKIARNLENICRLTKDGIRMMVKGVTAEGDRVALELQSHAELKNGRVYDQEYHTLVIIKDGKITEIREYYDTQHTYAVWFQK